MHSTTVKTSVYVYNTKQQPSPENKSLLLYTVNEQSDSLRARKFLPRTNSEEPWGPPPFLYK